MLHPLRFKGKNKNILGHENIAKESMCIQMGLGEARFSSPMFNPMLATSRGWQGLVLNIDHGYVGPIEYIEPISNIHEEVSSLSSRTSRARQVCYFCIIWHRYF